MEPNPQVPKPTVTLGWMLQMAWRDSRRSRSRLLLFTSSIVVGVAVLVAIQSFDDNLDRDIEGEKEELLGADFSIRNNQPLPDSILGFFDSLALEYSDDWGFAYQLYNLNETQNVAGRRRAVAPGRLTQLRALSGNYPFYGEIETEPASAAQAFREGGKAVMEKTLMIQLGFSVGDTVKVGEKELVVAGAVLDAPGQSGIVATVAPALYISLSDLEATGLVQKGSRVEYQRFYKLPKEVDIDQVLKEGDWRTRFRVAGVRYRTVEGVQEGFSQGFDYLNRFLSLVGFIALLLGCLGVASSVHVYVKEKLPLVAVLRCLGLSGRHAFTIYLLQIGLAGLGSAVIGALIGSAFQVALPLVLEDFLPVEVSYNVSWSAMGFGIAVGMLIAVLFGLLPLLVIRRTSPLMTLRASSETTGGADPLRWLVGLGIGLFITGFSYIQIRNPRRDLIEIDALGDSITFTIGLAIALGVLWGFSQLLIRFTRLALRSYWSYPLRQAVANLFRPNNQTTVLTVSVGLGTLLVTTLYVTQSLLTSQLQFADREGQPNLICFNIPSDAVEEVERYAAEETGVEVLKITPVVAMKLVSFRGKEAAQYMTDTVRANRLPSDIFRRQYRVTYRDELEENEEIAEGELPKPYSGEGPVPVTVSANHASRMDAQVGDKMTFDVQGRLIECVMVGTRDLDIRRFDLSFTVLFPTGVLERAPKDHALVARAETDEQSAKFQREMVARFPSTNIIDIDLIMSKLDEVLSKISFVIEFMASFSILTGILVLVNSVIISKYQRIRESVLLRTIGASRGQITLINALEYFFLGFLAANTGVLLAIGATYALKESFFEIPDPFIEVLANVWVELALAPALIVALAVTIGLLNIRSVIVRPPLEVLREEVG